MTPIAAHEREQKALPVFSAPYAPPDEEIAAALLASAPREAAAEARIDARATRLVQAIRAKSGGLGGIEDFLRAFALSTREGLALMVLAEALLRVPDAATQDRLIEDKLATGDWSEHGRGEKMLVAASIWALGVTSRILHPGDTPESIIAGVVKRLGQPAVRAATRQAMRVLGHHFVLGETISQALQRAKPLEAEGFSYSFDMLGEGARTGGDADLYFERYAQAIETVGNSAPAEGRRGISVKLSALHPRYEPLQRKRALSELVPRLRELAQSALDHGLMLTIDAEEADRLELSLEVIAALAADRRLDAGVGFGIAVQAYQKRAAAVIDWARELAAATRRQMSK